MSDYISVPIFLFVSLFSLVAASLILIQFRGISKADKLIIQSQQNQQNYQNLLNEIQALENKYPVDSTPNEIYKQIEQKKQDAAKTLCLINPGLDKRLSFYQVNEDLGQLQARKDRESHQLDNVICQNCGSKVHGGDKFCANCGFRLQG